MKKMKNWVIKPYVRARFKARKASRKGEVKAATKWRLLQFMLWILVRVVLAARAVLGTLPLVPRALANKPAVGMWVVVSLLAFPGAMLAKSGTPAKSMLGNALLILSGVALAICCLLGVLMALKFAATLYRARKAPAHSPRSAEVKLALASLVAIGGVALVTAPVLMPHWQRIEPDVTKQASEAHGALSRHFSDPATIASNAPPSQTVRPPGSKIPAKADLLRQQLDSLTKTLPYGIDSHTGRKWFDRAADLFVEIAEQSGIVDDDLRSRKLVGLSDAEREEIYLRASLQGFQGHTPFERLTKVVDAASTNAKPPTNSKPFDLFQPADTQNWKWYWPEVTSTYLERRLTRLQELEKALPRD